MIPKRYDGMKYWDSLIQTSVSFVTEIRSSSKRTTQTGCSAGMRSSCTVARLVADAPRETHSLRSCLLKNWVQVPNQGTEAQRSEETPRLGNYSVVCPKFL